MVEPIFHCSSSMLGNTHQENAVIDLFCTLSGRETALRGAHDRWMGGFESSDAQQQSSRLKGYGFGTLLAPDNPTSGKETWIRRCISEKHGQRQQQESLEAIEQGGSPSNVSELGNNPPKTMQRAHSERLRMVGAVDKTEMRGGVVDLGKSPLALAQEAAEKGARSHWDFANLPTSSTGSKRSMTVSEVLLIQSIGQAVICTDLQGNITRWNRAAESIYLWKAEEVLGQNLAQLLSPKHLGKDLIEVIGKASHGESWSGPYPALRKDEVIISTVVTDTPIVDSNNKIIGIISVSFDVSSLPGVETTIRRSQSAEVISNEKEKEIITPTGSDDGKNMLSWRRVHLEAENQAEENLPDVNSNAKSSSNYLSVGRFSVQQLLRKLTIGTGQRQGDFTQFNSEVRESPTEEFGTDQGRRMPSQPIAGRTIEHSQTFPVYLPNDGIEGDSGEGDGSSLPLVVPSKRHGGGNGSSESSGVQEVVKEIMANSLVIPQLGVSTQSLSRSSSGSAPGSAMAPDASSVGSPVERLALDNIWTPGPGTALNFQQAEEDFQLQLALALRVAAEAAAVDDPDIANVRGSKGNTKQTTGISKMEATAYRYWVSSCLGYDDRIEDGFYVVWGMSPYVWSMCTDSTELGRMPPLENLRAVSINDATFEVVLVDRNMDPTLSELEDKAVGLAYESTDVLDMASELAKMVAKVMGGPLKSDEVLEKEWEIASLKLMQVLGTIVVPIGVLRVGLCRHRALLFKVLADSVGLACRLVRGGAFCGKDSDSSVVVKCNDDKEWMIDLLQNPGTRMSPDKRLAAPPTVIPSPLQFERMNPFAGTGVSVLHWTRGEPKSRDGYSAGDSLQRRNFSEPMRNVGSPTRMNGGDVPIQQGLDFFQAEGSQVANNKVREYDDNKEKYGLVNLLDRRGLTGQLDPKFRSTDGGEGNFFLENATKESNVRDKFQRPPSGQESRISESPRSGADQDHERVWAREGRRNSGSDDSGKLSDPSRMLDQIASESSDFEIAWEDVVMGERIGQGSYGKVYRGDWQGSDVAVKVFLDQDLKTEALEEFKSEVAIMRRLRHPNIVLFMGAVTKPPNLSIITEFCPRGSLYRLLHRPNRELDDRKRIRMAVDVAKGMNYLHRCSPPVVHRDLKSPNLLVDKNWTVKVADFGLSRQKHSTFLSSKSSAGTPEWMAPEVLRNEPSDEKSDVYSFGVILWELATLQVPWNGMNPVQVVGAVGFQHRRLSIPDHIDRSIAAIIQACWRTDTKLRPSFADLMQELKLLQQRPQAAQSPQPSSPTVRQSSLRKENDDANMD